MTQKANRILLRIALAMVLVLFIMPFNTRSDGRVGLRANGIVSALGIRSPAEVTHTIKDQSTGAVHEVRLGTTRPNLFATAAFIAALLALGFTFSKASIAGVILRVGSISCAAALLLMKMTLDRDIAKNGYDLITIQWQWGFWLAFAVSFVAFVIACLPQNHTAGQTANQNDSGAVTSSPIISNGSIKQEPSGISLADRESAIKKQLSGFRDRLSVLEKAYLCSNLRTGPKEIAEIEKALADILAESDAGLLFLLERLMMGITISGNNISLHNWGEETWNELLKKQMIIKAFGAAKAKGALPELTKLSKANCSYGQWRECIAGPLSRTITTISA